MWCRLLRGEETIDVRAMAWGHEVELSPAQIPHRPDPMYGLPGGRQPPPGASAEQLEEAYQRGFREGETAATQRLAEAVNAKVTVLARSIEQLAMHRSRIQREAEPELVRLALAIARRILRRELTVDPEALLGILKAGLEKLESVETHRVRINPEHAGMLERLLEGSVRPITIVPDPGLPVGAVIFETTRGALDAGVDTQLKEIERGFADIYPR